MSDQPYDSAHSPAAQQALTEHFDLGANLYKFWASPRSVLRAIALGWARAGHPAHLHYAWDLELATSLDGAILETTRQAIALLNLEGKSTPQLFEPGCGIGGGVTQVAQQLPYAIVTGMSLVPSQLDIGRAMARARKLSNTRFVHGNYLATPFPDAHFDGIFAIESLVYTPNAEKPALFRELFRLLKPGCRFVCLDGVRLREPVNAQERRCIQEVVGGWTMALPPTPLEFQQAASAAGFELVLAADATRHIRASAQRIHAIGACVLEPLSWLARIPLLGGLTRPLGFRSPAHARRFIAACREQLRVFDEGLGGYYVHVLRVPK